MDATQRRKTETQLRDATQRRNGRATPEGTTSVVPQSRNASHSVIPNEVRDLLLNFADRRPGVGLSVSTFNCRPSTSASLTRYGTRAKS
jgi:hypothetical protein